MGVIRNELRFEETRANEPYNINLKVCSKSQRLRRHGLTGHSHSVYHQRFTYGQERAQYDMPTRFLNKAEAVASDRWVVIDATNQVLGRLATRAATLLSGKHKPNFAPFLITGDHVVIVNAGKVRLTGQKLDQKVYRRHTGYPGGLREVSARKLYETRPEQMIEEAILGMLPKNKLRKQMARRLRVYRGAEHPHAAQKPETLI